MFFLPGGWVIGRNSFRTAEPAINEFIVALHVSLPFQKIDLPITSMYGIFTKIYNKINSMYR